MEHEMCVVTWNVNNSSAHYDFLCDMIQCQANVVICHETQHMMMAVLKKWDGAC